MLPCCDGEIKLYILCENMSYTNQKYVTHCNALRETEPRSQVTSLDLWSAISIVKFRPVGF